jgi:hypothetical protein
MAALLQLLDEFRTGLEAAPAGKRERVIEKAVNQVAKWVKDLKPGPDKSPKPIEPVKPTNKQLDLDLLANPMALKIRGHYNQNRKAFDLRALGQELGVDKKKPQLDDFLRRFYFPDNRLAELEEKFRAILQSDPSTGKKKTFTLWGGKLRSLASLQEVSSELTMIAEKEGLELVREFAQYLNVKDGTRKLARNASQKRAIEAVASHLWSEKMTSRAQAGA